MQNQWWARFCTLILFSVGIGLWLAAEVRHDHLVGRAAYLQQKGQLFDRSTVLTHPLAHTIWFIITIALCIALYELIAFGMLALFFRSKS